MHTSNVYAFYKICERNKNEYNTLFYNIFNRNYIWKFLYISSLQNTKKTKDYVAGKKNPFASVETKQDSTNSENTNGTTNNNTNTGSNSNTSVDEDEGYLPNKGTK